MRLKVLLPDRVLLDEEVDKVTAEGAHGYFCLLPRHVDMMAALVPGLLYFEGRNRPETFIAVDEGVLVKRGGEVVASVRNAALGKELGSLKEIVENRFKALDDEERKTRTALARMESDFVRRLVELRDHG